MKLNYTKTIIKSYLNNNHKSYNTRIQSIYQNLQSMGSEKMKVAQRINEILKAKNISKRELAKRLIDLDMRTTKTGETPTESSVYAYLNGNIEIKADMIPFIAEALNICEQELFTYNAKDTLKILAKIYPDNMFYTKYNRIVQLLDYISPKSLETLEKTLLQYKNKTLELNKIIEKI